MRRYLYVAAGVVALVTAGMLHISRDEFGDYYSEYYEALSEETAKKITELETDCDEQCLVDFMLLEDDPYPIEGYLLDRILGSPDDQLDYIFASNYGLFSESAETEIDPANLAEEWQIKAPGSQMHTLFNLGAQDILADYLTIKEVCEENGEDRSELASFRQTMHHTGCL